MSPLPQGKASVSTTSTFFSAVSTQGFPAPKQTGQKWKDLLPQPDSKKAEETDNKMVVQCSQRHDYGKNSLLDSVSDAHPHFRLERLGRLLAAQPHFPGLISV